MSSYRSITVPFQGDGGGTGQLSWGQWELWEGLDRLRTWMPIGAVAPLPPGTTLAEVVSQLRFMMERYQTMRTRLRFNSDGPIQVVATAGEIELEVADATDEEDPATVAAAIDQRFRESSYDFSSQWPLRMAVVRHRGALTHQVTVMCHLVTDATGAAVVGRELAARDPRTGRVASPAAAMQPLAQAQWQRSRAGVRQSAHALRYWEEQLRAIPAQRFWPSRDPREPRYWQVGFDSPATHHAVRAIAARAGMDTAPVLLTVFCVALARLTGLNPVATRVIVDNRFRPGLADVVGPLAQAGLLVVDLAGLTFQEAVAVTRQRSLVGYKYAYFDAAQVYELIAKISQEREEQIHLGCFFNDRRIGVRQRDAEVGETGLTTAAPDQISAVRRQTTIRWERQQSEPFEELFLHVNDVPDTLDMTALFDTHYLAPGDVERLLRDMEDIAVRGALDPATSVGVPGRRSS